MLKKIGLGLLGLVVVVGSAGFVFVQIQTSAYDESIGKKYDFPLTAVTLSTDPEVIARGKHLAEALAGCTTCHGDNMAGGRVEPMGPVGTMVNPNVTAAGYTDAELMRLLRHGVKKDGTTVRMMPVYEFGWWPDADRIAVISWVRTLPKVEGQPGKLEVTWFGKVLDRMGSVPFDVARRVDHTQAPTVLAPAPTAEYGKLLAIGCTGCHGEKHCAGGKIPGAPPAMPVPLNLTPHETGLKGWTYDDFVAVIESGKRKNGKPLDPFMPIQVLKNCNETERKALWAYLSSLPPVEFGER